MNDVVADDGVPAAGTERWGETEFVPGSHVGLVGRLTVALIEAGHTSTRDRLWRLVASDAPIDDLLDELSSTGLKSLPSFAVAQVDGDDLRLVARGATRVTVTFSDGSRQELDASDVRTWREDVVADVARLSLSLPNDGHQPEVDQAERFFVLAGSVPAASLERRFDGADVLAPAVAASWEPAPVPPPQSDAALPAAFQQPVPEAPAVAVEELPESAVEELPTPAVGISVPPEDSNETINSIDFADPAPVSASTTAPRSAAGSESGAPPDDGEGNYDFIYGHTVARSVEGAAVRAGEEPAHSGGLISSVPEERSEVAAVLAGDHDGMTISRADLAAMTSAPSGSAAVGPDQVLAVLCGSGHPSPPHAATCRVCGAALGTSVPVSVPRPPLGVLVFSNGERVVADRTVLIGRNPRVSGTLTGELPRIVKLESAGQGLSRTHAEVRIEGWQMLLEDLQSTNGTEVTLPGQAPRRLHAGDPVALVAGTTVDFGEELQCRVEVVS